MFPVPDMDSRMMSYKPKDYDPRGGGGLDRGPSSMMDGGGGAKVLISNLPDNSVTKEELEGRFAKYGKLLGVTISFNTATLIYDSERDAQQAIRHEHKTMLKSNRIDVTSGGSRPPGPGAGPPMGRGGIGLRKSPPPPSMDRGYRGPPRDGYDSYGRMGPPPARDRSPLRGGDPYDSRYKDYPPSSNDRLYPKDRYPRDPYARPSGPPDKQPPLDKRYSGMAPEPPLPYSSKYSGGRPDGPPADSYGSSPAPPAGYGGGGGPPLPPGNPNDCEIIVINKMLQPYAERIEHRLKNLGLKVDLLFLKDESLLGRAIDNLSAGGCLFAMEVGEQNEVHGSITINMLHTNPPQSHRNIPMDDGLKLVACSFHEYIRNYREPRPEPMPVGSYLPPTMEVQRLLYLLSDGRYITSTEIDKVIKYLEERKDKMASFKSGSAAGGLSAKTEQPTPVETPSSVPPGNNNFPPSQQQPPPQPAPNDDEKSAEMLQQRIINLITQTPATSASQQASSSPDMQQQQQSQQSQGGNGQPEGSTYINFASPNVQKALDNLMQTGPSLLKNIASIPELLNQQQQQQVPSSMGGYGAGPVPPGGGGMPPDRMMPPMGGPLSSNPPGGYGGSNHYGGGSGTPQQGNSYRQLYGSQSYHPRRY